MAKGTRAEVSAPSDGQAVGEGKQGVGRRKGMSGLTGFGLGFAVAAVMGAAGGALAQAFRPVLRTAIKGGILTGRWVSQVAEETREHFEDVVAEARHELGEKAEVHAPHGHSHHHLRPKAES